MTLLGVRGRGKLVGNSASQKRIENIHMEITTFEILTAVHHQVECDFISTPRETD